MRIFYIAHLDEKHASTGAQRMRALEALGNELIPFDTAPHESHGGRWMRSLCYRTSWGPLLSSLNQAILERSRGIECDMVWIDKGVWIYPQTIEELRRRHASAMVHYTPDPAIVFHRTRHFARGIPLYDVCVTTKTFEIELYEQAGAQRVILSHQGYGAEFFDQPIAEADRSRFGADVCFIGHCEDHYCRVLRAAVAASTSVAIWGRWQRYLIKYPDLRRYWKGAGLWNEQYAAALGSAKICLGLLSKWIPEQVTTRSFEIPASGSMLLAERTDEHQEAFAEGREAEFFSSEEELQSKIRFYLKDEAARQRIAAAGRQRCIKSGYDYGSRMRTLFSQIQDVLQPHGTYA